MIDFKVVISSAVIEVLKRKLRPELNNNGYTLDGIDFDDILDGQYCFSISFHKTKVKVRRVLYIGMLDFSPNQKIEKFDMVAVNQETGEDIIVPITV